jgi:hypothetical protein
MALFLTIFVAVLLALHFGAVVRLLGAVMLVLILVAIFA